MNDKQEVTPAAQPSRGLPEKLEIMPGHHNGHLLIDPRFPDRVEVNAGGANLAAEIVSRWNAHAALVEALTKIAAFEDVGASADLAKTGSYGFFDEPFAVKIARAALASVNR